jgi:hypothetical protein
MDLAAARNHASNSRLARTTRTWRSGRALTALARISGPFSAGPIVIGVEEDQNRALFTGLARCQLDGTFEFPGLQQPALGDADWSEQVEGRMRRLASDDPPQQAIDRQSIAMAFDDRDDALQLQLPIEKHQLIGSGWDELRIRS